MASEYDRGIRAPPRPPACRDADHRINGTDDVINAYDNGDTEMSDRAKNKAVEDIGDAIGGYEDIPSYSESDTTGAKDDAPKASTIEAEK